MTKLRCLKRRPITLKLHTLDTSVEPPILSATIEAQDLQVPPYVASTFVQEEELLVEAKQQVFA